VLPTLCVEIDAPLIALSATHVTELRKVVIVQRMHHLARKNVQFSVELGLVLGELSSHCLPSDICLNKTSVVCLSTLDAVYELTRELFADVALTRSPRTAQTTLYCLLYCVEQAIREIKITSESDTRIWKS
jgi:hypothetical protein